VRAIEAGPGVVTVTGIWREGSVRFEVIDAGAALPPQCVEALRSNSVRALSEELAESPAELSLHLAVRAFRTLGGHVEIDSSPGLGTRVAITFVG
jgi:signal transduction histidine kinase